MRLAVRVQRGERVVDALRRACGWMFGVEDTLAAAMAWIQPNNRMRRRS